MKEKINKVTGIVSMLLIIIVTILLIYIFRLQESDKMNQNLITSLNSEITFWKDKDSISHARIQVIETQNTKQFLEIQSKDSTINELQGVVKKYEKKLKEQGSATIIKTEEQYSFEVEDMDMVQTHDSIYSGSDTIYNDWYAFNYSYIFNIISNKFSIKFNLITRNTYAVVLGYENRGVFKDPIPFAEVVNYNPYSETTSVRSYQVSLPKPKRWGIGPIIGVGYNFGQGFGGFIGIGISYNLIQF